MTNILGYLASKVSQWAHICIPHMMVALHRGEHGIIPLSVFVRGNIVRLLVGKNHKNKAKFPFDVSVVQSGNRGQTICCEDGKF